MATQKKIAPQVSAETKIKEAARKLFTEKGFDAVKTRDIAVEAGINLALLNYYFRSKQKLYDLIMEENMKTFKQGIAELFGDTKLDVPEKLEKMAQFYIDEFIANRDLPLFIIKTMNSAEQYESIMDKDIASKSRKLFVNQIHEYMIQNKLKVIHPAHIISNLIGLILFPFLISPLLKRRANLNDKEFVELMVERKELIPIWVKNMMQK